MTNEKPFKRLVRARMRATGQSYTQVRDALLNEGVQKSADSRDLSERVTPDVLSRLSRDREDGMAAGEQVVAAKVAVQASAGKVNTYRVLTADEVHEFDAHSYVQSPGSELIRFSDQFGLPVATFRESAIERIEIVGRVTTSRRSREDARGATAASA